VNSYVVTINYGDGSEPSIFEVGAENPWDALKNNRVEDAVRVRVVCHDTGETLTWRAGDGSEGYEK
jgi:hypothetical protein